MAFHKGCESFDVDQSGILTARFPAYWGRPETKLNLNDCIGFNGSSLVWYSSGFVPRVSEIKVSNMQWRVEMEYTMKDGGFLPTSKWKTINIDQWIAIKEYKLVFLRDEYLANVKKMAEEAEERAKQPTSFSQGVKEGWGQGGWIGAIVGGIGSFF